MVLLGSILHRLRRDDPCRSRRSERGATLTEYGMLVAVMVVTSIGAISLLEDESGSYLVDTGSDIGTPRELSANLDPDLPTGPSWLTQPPPPTTTTTAPPTTTTTTPPGPTSTVTPGPTSTTIPAPGVVWRGPMARPDDPGKCYEVRHPGTAGSTTQQRNCNGGGGQVVEATGTAIEVVLAFADPINAGLCFQEDGNRIILAGCDGSAKQLFDVITNGDGTTTLISRSSGRCLSGEGRLRLRPCDGRASQFFII